MSGGNDQKAVLFQEIMEILEEQRALQKKNQALQQRLEELLLTLELKTTTEVKASTTPQKLSSLVPRLTVDDDDDLDAAPLGWAERVGGGGDGEDTFTTESGWERDNGSSTDSLSLSYSFSPATHNGSSMGRSLLSGDGLSPAPIVSRRPTASTPPTPALPSAAPKKQQSETPPPGDWSKVDTGVPGFVAGAAAAVVGLFGGSPSAKKKAEKPRPRQERRDSEASESDASTVQADPSEKEEEEDAEVDEEEEEEEEEVQDAEEEKGALTALSAEERSAREAQAQGMSMSALSRTLQEHLAAAGRGGHPRGLKETIEDSCVLLGVPFTGVLKKDATACYVEAGSLSSSMPSPMRAPTKLASPVPRSRHVSTFLTAEPEAEPEPLIPRNPATPLAMSSSSHWATSVVTPTSGPSNPAAYAIFSPTNPTLAAARLAFQARLQSYYAVHNPTKMDQLEEILDKFAGKEEVLVGKLEKLYGAKFPPK